jgi:hypothetical protein
MLKKLPAILLIIGFLFVIGCSDSIDDIIKDFDRDVDSDYEIVDSSIDEIDILLLETQPVQVIVVVRGVFPDGCYRSHETHQTQEGNTITLQMTDIYHLGSMCTQAIIAYKTQVDIGMFAPGHYKVIVNGIAQEFRVD